jgi:RNA polymerase sigma-70 factor (ECF subfamily)
VPIDPTSEQALVARAQNGDNAAVAQLYELYAPRIFRYLYFRVHERETAEDLTADVFVRMVQALPAYQQRGRPFAAWLFRVAHDRAVDHHRRQQYRRTETLSDQLADDVPGTESAALGAQMEQQMMARLRHLTDDQQLVVQLRFIEGCSLEETAAVMEKTLGAVKALQHRALRQLARGLER